MKRVILTLAGTLLLLFLSSQVYAQAATLNLSWTDTSSNETGFEVERCQGSGCTGFTRIGAPGANVQTYIDSTLLEGTTYCYRVRAVNSGGASGYSNTACATTLVAAPTAPTNLLVK